MGPRGDFGIVLFAADYGLIYWGEGNGVESGLTAILFATLPFQTALFAHVLIRDDRLTAQKIVGVAVGFAGILLVFRGQLESPGLSKFFPMLAIVLSATCASSATVALKRWGHDTDPVSFNGLAMGVGAILVTPIVAVFLGVAVGNEAFDPLALLGAAITLSGIYLSTSKRAATLARVVGGGAVRKAPAGDMSDPKE